MRKKILGGIRPSARAPSRGIAGRWCPYHCPGEFREGHWCHTPRCPGIAVLWMLLGYTVADWACPFFCTPVRLVHTLTHDRACRYWTQIWAQKGKANDWAGFVPVRLPHQRNPRQNVSETSVSRALRAKAQAVSSAGSGRSRLSKRRRAGDVEADPSASTD